MSTLLLHCGAYQLRAGHISHFLFEYNTDKASTFPLSFLQMTRKFYIGPQVVPPALFWEVKRLQLLSVSADQAISGGAYSLIEW